jgi:Primase C terminal 2 (PriCT-2)
MGFEKEIPRLEKAGAIEQDRESPYKNCTTQRVENPAKNGAAQQINDATLALANQRVEITPWREPIAIDVLNAGEIRNFLGIINAQAARLAETLVERKLQPGRMQLVFLNPLDGTTIPSRYAIGDVESMVKDAIFYAAELNWNVYVEGRTVRSDLKENQRGVTGDTVFVFALAVDDDRDKGRSCKLDIESSLIVESSPGNRHLWLFFDRPMGPPAIELGRRLRAAAGDVDACSGTITSLFRVAGSPNFPDAGKVSRGRSISGTSILEHSGKLWSPDEMERAFPPIPECRSTVGADHHGVGDFEVELLAQFLRAIPNNPPADHKDWLYILFACKWTADQAVSGDVKKQIKALFYAWSDQAKGCRGSEPDPYDKKINGCWNRAKSNRDRPITFGTIVKYAEDRGLSLKEAEWKITEAWADSIDRATEDYVNNLLNDVGAS